MGNAFQDQGDLQQAISCYQEALKLKPEFAEAHSNLLFGSHYNDPIDHVQLFLQHKQWAAQHASPLAMTIKPHVCDSSPERRLRIGYVSPDFRKHSVAYFIEPVIASHDQTAYEIICYSDVAHSDPVTDRIKGLASSWRNIFGMSHEQADELIRSDQIDILVDLAGHTSRNRMLLFARKPAPIQVTYLGYGSTTGLSTMDYRITDSFADPPGKTDHLHTEELVRLPQGFLCYKPPEQTPDVGNLPARDSGCITFGSFKHRAKITPGLVSLWSKLLNTLPNAQIILKSKPLSDIGTQNLLREMFIQNGVSPARTTLTGHAQSLSEHLELYNRVDIGLDTFPYNGATTTCEAIWMGVPVITLAGETHVSRLGASILSNVGLPELIAGSPEEYLKKGVQLANDLNRLQGLRADLRTMMARIPPHECK